MGKQDLAFKNLQWLICHKPHQTMPNQFYKLFQIC